MLISKVKFERFKSLRNVELELGRLTVLLGANASGKTSILNGIHNLCRAVNSDAAKIFHGTWHPDNLLTANEEDKSIVLACYSDVGLVRLDLSKNGGGPTAIPLGKTGWTYDKLGYPRQQGPDGPREEDEHQVFSSIRFEDFSSIRSEDFLHLNASELAKPCYSDAVVPRVEYDGHGLGAVLAFMALSHRANFNSIEAYLRKIVPSFQSLDFFREPVYRRESEIVRFGDETIKRSFRKKYQGTGVSLVFEGGKVIDARHCSEGTLLALGLLTVLLGPMSPKLLLMDDIEHGLHPMAQEELIRILRAILEEQPELQILASAHSPFLADFLTIDEVRLLTLDADGNTVLGSLSGHPEFEKWKNEMAPGELWSLFGEKWLAEEAG